MDKDIRKPEKNYVLFSDCDTAVQDKVRAEAENYYLHLDVEVKTESREMTAFDDYDYYDESEQESHDYAILPERILTLGGEFAGIRLQHRNEQYIVLKDLETPICIIENESAYDEDNYYLYERLDIKAALCRKSQTQTRDLEKMVPYGANEAYGFHRWNIGEVLPAPTLTGEALMEYRRKRSV